MIDTQGPCQQDSRKEPPERAGKGCLGVGCAMYAPQATDRALRIREMGRK